MRRAQDPEKIQVLLMAMSCACLVLLRLDTLLPETAVAGQVLPASEGFGSVPKSVFKPPFPSLSCDLRSAAIVWPIFVTARNAKSIQIHPIHIKSISNPLFHSFPLSSTTSTFLRQPSRNEWAAHSGPVPTCTGEDLQLFGVTPEGHAWHRQKYGATK